MFLTFEDYEKAVNKAAFLLEAVTLFKSSTFYRTAIESQNYYEGKNSYILNRLSWFYNSAGIKETDRFKANNQVGNQFFTKIVRQGVSYLLANGLTTDSAIKEGLGRKFDVKLRDAGTKSLVDGVAWAYCYFTERGFEVDIWRGSEVLALHGELDNVPRVIIRFWQLDATKPLFIEVYEQDGKTTYMQPSPKKDMAIIQPKTPYIIKKQIDKMGESIIGVSNWSVLPIFPLFANDVHQSTLTRVLKNKLDLYDIILSDFGNNLEDNNDIYWVLRNYNGQNIGQFLADYKYYKAIKTDESGDATPHRNEVPYEARKTALDILRKEIFDSAMALDTSILSGGSLTNIAIKAAMTDLDLKTDIFENNAIDFCDNIIQMYLEYKNQSKETKYEINFIRRSIVNDTEVIENIQKMRMDISLHTALELNPYIEDVEEELVRIDEEAMSKIEFQQNNPEPIPPKNEPPNVEGGKNE